MTTTTSTVHLGRRPALTAGARLAAVREALLPRQPERIARRRAARAIAAYPASRSAAAPVLPSYQR